MSVLDEQVAAVRMEMQSTVDRLEAELAELQQSRQTLQQDSALQLESLERLRREYAELQQRVSTMRVLPCSMLCVLPGVASPWDNLNYVTHAH